MAFSTNELERYKRQMMMAGWGQETQEKLKNSTVFIAGAGGLGSPVSIYLAAAGIGHIIICDFDSPDYSNLNRQILHNPSRIGVNKALSAKITLSTVNSDIKITAHTEKITADNVDALVANSDIILDCMDNFATRYILNDAAIRKAIPLVYGSIWGIDGRMSFIKVPETPCLRCLFQEAPPSEVFPVLGTTPAVIGSLQALEALKYLSGTGTNLKGKLLVWEGANVEFRKFKIYKDPNCPSCGGK
ncbi:MAG: HesA/MoeB/ThiF family protein [Candidatus Magnetominusculus sp. LBB02]|nr:HesA/MoeB/ThiF family protein [Candidatus Magnetominusculus sp. LBB02]